MIELGKAFAPLALMARAATILGLLGLALLSGCVSDRRPVADPSEYEYSDQDEYAKTSPTGPGSESSSGYYGVGNSEEPSHQPAKPTVSGGHQPY